MYTSPTLYKTSSTDAELQWNIYTRPANVGNSWEIVTLHGQVGGKIQENVVVVNQGKNLGKANQTTIEQQADSEAQSKYNKQIDKGYSTERGGASKKYRPMLAHKYEEHIDKVQFPCYVQPKLDGMRCIAVCKDGNITLTSRGNKPIVYMQHIVDELSQYMKNGDVYDGELYSHDVPFQDVMKFTKKKRKENELVKYHIYDVISNDDFRTRFLNERMVNLDVMGFNHIHLVMTNSCLSHEDVVTKHNWYVSLGYEGAILRHGECKYKEGGRSNQVLKVKDFIDAEFEIVDVIPADKRPEHAIFVCLMTGTTTTFTVNPEGSHENRVQYLKDRDSLIGKQLTVKYFELTTSKVPVPRFPVGIAVRDYE